MRTSTALSLVLLAAFLAVSGCDSGGEDVSGLPDIPAPIDPGIFVEGVDNPYWPLTPGTSYSYLSVVDGVEVTVEVEVLEETRTVDGVEATVVRDREYEDGHLVEETLDWYAQDEDGNVWYLGEETWTYINGVKTSNAGSWESGVGRARAGMYMPADPAVGDYFYQEYDKGNAQDVSEIVQLGLDVQVPAGVFKGCIQTRETTPLDGDVLELKHFCPSVGLVLTIDVAEGNAREELVSWGGL